MFKSLSFYLNKFLIIIGIDVLLLVFKFAYAWVGASNYAYNNYDTSIIKVCENKGFNYNSSKFSHERHEFQQCYETVFCNRLEDEVAHQWCNV